MSTLTPAQKFRMAADRVEVQRKQLIAMSTTLQMQSSSTDKIMATVMDIVCQVHDVLPEELRADDRTRRFSYARHAYCYICMKLDPMCTLQRVGKSINRDHSTVINSLNKCEQLRATDIQYAAKFERCLELIANSSKKYMQRIQFKPEQIAKTMSKDQQTMQRAMDAVKIVAEFMNLWNEHEMGQAMGEPDIGVELFRPLRKQAIEKGF